LLAGREETEEPLSGDTCAAFYRSNWLIAPYANSTVRPKKKTQLYPFQKMSIEKYKMWHYILVKIDQDYKYIEERNIFQLYITI
jgi:hypothetical protein